MSWHCFPTLARRERERRSLSFRAVAAAAKPSTGGRTPTVEASVTQGGLQHFTHARGQPAETTSSVSAVSGRVCRLGVRACGHWCASSGHLRRGAPVRATSGVCLRVAVSESHVPATVKSLRARHGGRLFRRRARLARHRPARRVRSDAPAMGADDCAAHGGARRARRKKRANHNELERKRRQHQKDRLNDLKDVVPQLKQERPSTVLILTKARVRRPVLALNCWS